MLMFIPVVPAILTRIERHFGRFRNSVSWVVDHSFDRAKRLCTVFS